MKRRLNKITKGFLLTSMLIAVLALMAACGGSGLVGAWDDAGFSVEFSRNGNGTSNFGDLPTFTWEANDGALIIRHDGRVKNGSYEIVGSSLILRNLGELSGTWTRR